MNELAVLASVLLGIAATLGVAFAVFRSSARTKTVELYEQELAIQRQINDRLETENKRLAGKVDDLTKENARWQESVTQKARVEELASILRAEEKARRESEASIMMLLKDIVAQLKGRRGEIS